MDGFFQERAKARKYFLNILNNGDLRELGDLKRNSEQIKYLLTSLFAIKYILIIPAHREMLEEFIVDILQEYEEHLENKDNYKLEMKFDIRGDLHYQKSNSNLQVNYDLLVAIGRRKIYNL